MSDLISIAEASRLYRVSERSIRNWIRDGLFSPGKMRVNGKLQYAIDPKELERVMEDRNMIAIPIRPKEDNRIQQLEARLNDVERRLALLEQSQASVTSEETTLAPAPRKRVRTAQAALPGGLITAASFAILHFPAKDETERDAHEDRITSMVTRQITRGQVQAVQGSFKTGKTTAKYALDTEGRAGFYQINHNRDGWQDCPDCPHKVNSGL